jgi:fibronectin type 3 domain-containing protein
MLAGCGYVGPVLPPSPQIPAQVTDLRAVQRGGKIIVDFDTPPRTTDNVAVKHFSTVDLRIGPAVTPFDFEEWANGAREYPVEPPIASDPDDPQPIPMNETISAEDWIGKKVVVAVRTAERKGDHFSSWSNRVVLDVVAALEAPTEVKGESIAEGVALHWDQTGPDQQYRILRLGPGDKEPAVVGTADKPNYVDTTAQFDTHYEYRVVAIKGTAESAVSKPFSITPKDTFPPSVPGNITALAGPESVEVSWQRSPEADLKGYYLYRAVGEGEFHKVGGLLSLPSYSDKQVERGKTYRYAVSAVDKNDNESAKSVETQVTF